MQCCAILLTFHCFEPFSLIPLLDPEDVLDRASWEARGSWGTLMQLSSSYSTCTEDHQALKWGTAPGIDPPTKTDQMIGPCRDNTEMSSLCESVSRKG